jgi:hypothetical protein
VSLSAGTPFTIDANGTTPISSAKISSTAAIVLYWDSAVSDIEARVVNLDETVNTAETLDTTPTAGGAGSAAVCVLSAVKAIVAFPSQDSGGSYFVAVVTISGTTLTYQAASELSPSGSSDFSTDAKLVALSSTAFILIINNSSQADAYYFTVSGNTITEESVITYDGSVTSQSLASLTSLKAVAAYSDSGDSDILKMVVLSISGTTISAGTPVNIEGSDVGSGSFADTALTPVDGTHVLLAYANTTDSNTRAVVITVAGSVPSANTRVTVVSSVGLFLDLVPFSATVFGLFYDDQMAEITLSGVVVTVDTPASFTVDTPTSNRAAVFSATAAIVTYTEGGGGTYKAVIITATAAGNALDMAPMRRPADIDADGTYIYLAALNASTFPVLIKILADLSTDGTIVFNPGAGTDIGVQAGNFNASSVWIAGDFGGTNVVEKTEDAGASFTVKDPATFGAVTAFAAGPDSDDKIMVVDANEDIHESTDNGATWTTHNSAVGLSTLALARLGKNTQEIVLGNEGSATDNVDYSPNSGVNLEDFSSGFPEQDVTGVIVG